MISKNLFRFKCKYSNKNEMYHQPITGENHRQQQVEKDD